jgi:cytochrome c
MNCPHLLGMGALSLIFLTAPAGAQTGDAARGERIFRVCAPCHSLEADRNMTGPSLADLWNRKAGGLPSFPRYSPPLKGSGVVWNDATLDPWLADPQHFIPGNTMTFPGVKDARQRADLLAFLKQASEPGSAHATTAQRGRQMGSGMMGMMGDGGAPNLKQLEADERVAKVAHCRDTYRVTTADGKTRDFWERNLRFKTDASADGPQRGAPAIVGAGMMGDRADVIFAGPEEISAFIAGEC